MPISHIAKFVIHRGPAPKNGNPRRRWLTTIHMSSDVTFTSGQRYASKLSARHAAITLVEKILTKEFEIQVEDARTGALATIPNSIFD